MATLTANATASLSANGNSTATGSISWTAPSLPDGVAAWDSIVISGTWSWGGKGNIQYVNINGTNTTADTPFSVLLGTSATSPLSITCQGNNKNATGSNFNWNNLIVIYEYTDPNTKKCYIKVGGVWNEYGEVYKKINGAWVKQDLASAFDSNTNYVRG